MGNDLTQKTIFGTMKANEIRIGNLVLKDGKEFVVDGKEFSYLADCHGGVEVSMDVDYTPIELTEEWLERFGFRKINERVFSNRPYTITTQGAAFYFGFQISDAPITNLKEISSVHELQNLYFALTKTELKISIPHEQRTR